MSAARERFEAWYMAEFGGVDRVFKSLREGNTYKGDAMIDVSIAWKAWQAATVNNFPETWRKVPYQPTQAMLNAAYKCAFECDGEHCPQTIRLSDDDAETLYQAMVRAAP